MTDIAIRVENLSKRYTIGRAQQRHDTPSAGSGQAWACGAPRPVLSSVEASSPSPRPVLSESKHRTLPGYAGQALPFDRVYTERSRSAQGRLQRHGRAPGLRRRRASVVRVTLSAVEVLRTAPGAGDLS